MLQSTLKGMLILLVSALLLSCTSQSTKQGTVGVERKQMLLVSEKEMEQGAEKAYADILKQAKAENKLNTNPQEVKRLRIIADRLIPQVKIFREDALKWDWEVNLIKSDQLNAWCMPGGKIAFYTGIIHKLHLTDAEIAAIMGHEIAHALREHGRERASQAMLGQAGLTLVSLVTDAPAYAMDASNMVMNVTFLLPNSRMHETEADRMGVELAARAGYDPYAAVDVWKKMSKIATEAPPEFLSTHPSNSSRIKDLKKYAKKVEPLYAAAQNKRS